MDVTSLIHYSSFDPFFDKKKGLASLDARKPFFRWWAIQDLNL